MTQRRKFDSLQAGRGIAALMVVVCHVGSFYGPKAGLWNNASVFRWLSLGKYGIDFFFILSGVVILLAHWNDLDVPSRASSFVWKRFRRIYPIYWFFLIPTVLKQLRVDTGHAADQRSPYVVLSSFLLVHIRSLAYNLAPSWTLFHEVLFYSLFTVLLLRRRVGILLLCLWFGASLFFPSPAAVSSEPESYLQMLFSPLHLLFAFGLLVGSLLHRRSGPAQVWALSSGLLIFGGAILLNTVNPQESTWLRLMGGAGLALAVLSGAERECLHKLHVPRAMVFLGDASYSIYLAHFMVVSAVARKAFQLDQARHLPAVVWMVAMFAAAVAAGLAAHLAVERPLLRWLSRTPTGSMVATDDRSRSPDAA